MNNLRCEEPNFHHFNAVWIAFASINSDYHDLDGTSDEHLVENNVKHLHKK